MLGVQHRAAWGEIPCPPSAQGCREPPAGQSPAGGDARSTSRTPRDRLTSRGEAGSAWKAPLSRLSKAHPPRSSPTGALVFLPAVASNSQHPFLRPKGRGRPLPRSAGPGNSGQALGPSPHRARSGAARARWSRPHSFCSHGPCPAPAVTAKEAHLLAPVMRTTFRMAPHSTARRRLPRGRSREGPGSPEPRPGPGRPRPQAGEAPPPLGSRIW